jgi:hypothetical protein
MTMSKLRTVLDTYARNFNMTAWPRTVLEPFEEAASIVENFNKQVATIHANPHLTPEGKLAGRRDAATAALAALKKWREPRLAGLDAHVSAHRSALLPTGEKPDARKVDFTLGLLQKYTPHEIAVFYNSASDAERLVMEAASTVAGRMPMKTPGGLVWQSLLDPEMVNEAVIARATAQNPEAATKLRELDEVRAMQVSVAGIAASDVKAALNAHQ